MYWVWHCSRWQKDTATRGMIQVVNNKHTENYVNNVLLSFLLHFRLRFISLKFLNCSSYWIQKHLAVVLEAELTICLFTALKNIFSFSQYLLAKSDWVYKSKQPLRNLKKYFHNLISLNILTFVTFHCFP